MRKVKSLWCRIEACSEGICRKRNVKCWKRKKRLHTSNEAIFLQTIDTVCTPFAYIQQATKNIQENSRVLCSPVCFSLLFFASSLLFVLMTCRFYPFFVLPRWSPYSPKAWRRWVKRLAEVVRISVLNHLEEFVVGKKEECKVLCTKFTFF